jgi:hypothetical protein
MQVVAKRNAPPHDFSAVVTLRGGGVEQLKPNKIAKSVEAGCRYATSLNTFGDLELVGDLLAVHGSQF